MKKKLVSLWAKQGPRGQYYTGQMADGTRVIAFINSPERKKNPKQPDLEVFEQEITRSEVKELSAEEYLFGPAPTFNDDDSSIPF